MNKAEQAQIDNTMAIKELTNHCDQIGEAIEKNTETSEKLGERLTGLEIRLVKLEQNFSPLQKLTWLVVGTFVTAIIGAFLVLILK